MLFVYGILDIGSTEKETKKAVRTAWKTFHGLSLLNPMSSVIIDQTYIKYNTQRELTGNHIHQALTTIISLIKKKHIFCQTDSKNAVILCYDDCKFMLYLFALLGYCTQYLCEGIHRSNLYLFNADTHTLSRVPQIKTIVRCEHIQSIVTPAVVVETILVVLHTPKRHHTDDFYHNIKQVTSSVCMAILETSEEADRLAIGVKNIHAYLRSNMASKTIFLFLDFGSNSCAFQYGLALGYVLQFLKLPTGSIPEVCILDFQYLYSCVTYHSYNFSLNGIVTTINPKHIMLQTQDPKVLWTEECHEETD